VAANADRQHAGQLIASGLTDQAEQLLRAVLKRNPKDHEAMAMLAQVLIRRRAFDEAQPLTRLWSSAERCGSNWATPAPPWATFRELMTHS
jgi:thioredoxin-like negative regulator of GroEL